MKVSSTVLPALAALLPLVSSSSSCCRDGVTSREFHKQVLDNYLGLWNGDYSQVDAILDPDVVVYADRLPSPSGVGSIPTHLTSREQFVGFVERSRAGWKEYSFEVLRWTSSDVNLAVRWRMHGVLGSNFTTFPTPLKPGAEVTYNGTDFLHMDACTGLIKEDNVAQDLITLFHAMELGKVTV